MKRNYKLMIVLLLLALKSMGQSDTAGFIYNKPLFDFEDAKPVFKLRGEQQANKQRFLRFSAVTGYREGLPKINGPFGMNFARHDDSVTMTSRIRMYNLTIPELLNHFPFNPNLLILEVQDPSKYVYDPKYGDKTAWLKKNSYCYELMVPLSSLSGIDQVNQFLVQAFHVSLSREKRKVKALVLVRTSAEDKIRSAGKDAAEWFKGRINNISLAEGIRANLDFTKKMPPMVDETGYTGMADLDLQHITDWSDLGEVRSALRRYDLDLREEIREVEDALVIREIKH